MILMSLAGEKMRLNADAASMHPLIIIAQTGIREYCGEGVGLGNGGGDYVASGR